MHDDNGERLRFVCRQRNYEGSSCLNDKASVSIDDPTMSGRRQHRRIIIDDSSSDESNEGSNQLFVAANNARRRRTIICNMEGLSDSSSSFEKYLESLRIGSFDEQEDDDPGFLADAETPSQVHYVKTEKEEESSDCTHPWVFDRAADEFYFDDSTSDDTIQWPALRLPGHLFRKLYGFQKDGVCWMGGLHHKRIGGLLGDDMGMVILNFLNAEMFSGIVLTLTLGFFSLRMFDRARPS